MEKRGYDYVGLGIDVLINGAPKAIEAYKKYRDARRVEEKELIKDWEASIKDAATERAIEDKDNIDIKPLVVGERPKFTERSIWRDFSKKTLVKAFAIAGAIVILDAAKTHLISRR